MKKRYGLLSAPVAVIACIVCILYIPVRAGAEQSSGNSLDNKIIRAAGGREALSRVKAVRATGSITAIVRRDSGKYERIWTSDGKLRVDINYSRSRELRLLSGGKGWRGSADNDLSRATGPRLDAMLYQNMVLALPFGLLDGTYELQYIGRDEFRGKEVDLLKFRRPDSPEVFVYLDTSGRVVRTTGVFKVRQGVSTNLTAEFGDFRKTGELVLPYRIDNFAGGMHIGRTIIDKYELNPDVNNIVFTPGH